MKNRSNRTYFSLVIDVSMNASIYPERDKRANQTLKDDGAYFSELNDESNSTEITINLERETRTRIKAP